MPSLSPPFTCFLSSSLPQPYAACYVFPSQQLSFLLSLENCCYIIPVGVFRHTYSPKFSLFDSTVKHWLFLLSTSPSPSVQICLFFCPVLPIFCHVLILQSHSGEGIFFHLDWIYRSSPLQYYTDGATAILCGTVKINTLSGVYFLNLFLIWLLVFMQ